MLLIAHRGWSAKFPENTILAFDEAIKAGALALEFDVQLDAEDEAVVFHDFILGRTTLDAEPQRVRELATEEFLELDVGAYKDEDDFFDTPPCLLSEVIDRYNDKIFLNIELKVFDCEDFEEVQTLARRTLEIIKEFNWSHGMISSFCPAILTEIKKHNKDLKLALLGPTISEQNLLSDAINLGAYAYNFDGRSGVSSEDIQKIHSAGLKAYAYTINDPKRASELKHMNLDGIFTDCIDIMKNAFES